MAVLHPSLEELDRLATPLEAGAREVARALARLDEDWAVYVRPSIGLEVPDFVAIHDRFGVCVIEVVGWSAGSSRPTDDGGIERLDGDGRWTAVAHPRTIAHHHRSVIYDQHIALPGDPGEPNDDVRAVVVAPDLTDRQAFCLLAHPALDAMERAVAVWGGDGLHQRLEQVVGGDSDTDCCIETLGRLRSHLITAGSASERPRPVALSHNTRLLALNPSNRVIRRARGAAGSGKTFGVAARAANLAQQGRRTLVLSFNVTLANRLRSLVVDRCAESGANPTLVVCSNFHSFCEHIVHEAELNGIETIARPGSSWATSMVARAEAAFARGYEQRFDAVLVDEGQDFAIAWWNLLREHVVEPGGEMLLVADPTQNLYERKGWSDEDRLAAAGFTDPWIDLTGTYRTPNDLTAITSDFARQHLDGERLFVESAPDRSEIGCSSGATTRHWIDVDGPGDLGLEVGREVVRLLRDHPELSPVDVVFLCEYHHDGVTAASVIEDAGYPVHHLFSRNPDDLRRTRRYRFWPDVASVKGSTVHSFKGWEAPVIVLGIGTDRRSKRSAYMSMTRASMLERINECFVSVVNSDKGLSEFGASFAGTPAEPVASAGR
jgi:hypothetical protein